MGAEPADTWWANMDQARAVKIAEAVFALIPLRIMALDRQALRALEAIKYAEACEESESMIGKLSTRYMDLQKQKQKLETGAGRLQFLDEALTAAHQRRKSALDAQEQ